MSHDIPVFVTLKPDKTVSEQRGAQVRAEQSYFNQGRNFFFEFHLVPEEMDASAPGWLEGPLRPGPLMGDCM